MTPDSPPPSSPASRLDRWLTGRGFVLALIVLVLVSWGYRRGADRWARAASPTGEALWIWQHRYHRDFSPTVFLAARDFFLESVPARARLLVAADEEYILTLNNQPVGRGGSPYEGRPDVYEVAPLLQAGGNRLVAELRNGRGQGGFLLMLEDSGSGRHLAISDGEWRIFPHQAAGLEQGWLPLEEGEAPRIWGGPPLGRWGKIRAPRAKALGVGFDGGGLPPETVRVGSIAPMPGGTEVPGQAVLLDFGREVIGYLSLGLAPREEREIGLLWVGSTPPDPYSSRPSSTILLLPGREEWSDAHPRRFRYALVVGLGAPRAAGLVPLPALSPNEPPPPDLDLSVASIEGKEGGAFGVVPPPSRAPVEDEVWRKLQGLAGGGGGKEL